MVVSGAARAKVLLRSLQQLSPARRHFSLVVCRQQQHQHQDASSTQQLVELPDQLRPNFFESTGKLEPIEPNQWAPVPAYRVLAEDGSLVGEMAEELSTDRVLVLYKQMLRLSVMDKVMMDCQRQGRISFYMTSMGEEAAQFGSADALEPHDWVFAQYREPGVVLHRGMSMRQMLAQCMGNREDLAKGRQMPIHYGSRQLNYVTISSPLGTQLPQAAGAAYALRLKAKQLASSAEPSLVACYFGEGAASEGDAHAAMNFAAVLDCPVIFICRNNGYAISTPSNEQYRGDGLVRRAIGYGMGAIRVDGNDLLAMYAATKRARQLALSGSRPILLEAMTYRVGHHSTSDDSTAYRSGDEVKAFDSQSNPLRRLNAYLTRLGIWDAAKETQTTSDARQEVIEALNWAEKQPKPSISSMFDDVYAELPSHIERQRDHLSQHLEEYGSEYPTNEYERV